tara:strand:+ start:224 stop:550 length:327 start_codon:yes stop_codon:yes gene_type:complete
MNDKTIYEKPFDKGILIGSRPTGQLLLFNYPPEPGKNESFIKTVELNTYQWEDSHDKRNRRITRMEMKDTHWLNQIKDQDTLFAISVFIQCWSQVNGKLLDAKAKKNE